MRLPVSRRDFFRLSAGGTAAMAGVCGGVAGLYAASDSRAGLARPADGSLLRRAPEAMPDGLTLVAAEGTADIGGGVRAPAWMLNDSLPSPLLRVRRGDPFRVTLRNELSDELILHWHGLAPPEQSDGHPRRAIRSGGTYDYGFTVEDRAGTYWYHSHAHMKTAKHTGSNARVFRLERSDGRPLVIIGNDGGLLERTVTSEFVDIAPAERLDVLVDLREVEVGGRVTLRSRGFTLPVGLDVMGGGGLQGVPMNLLQLRVTRRTRDSARIPEELSTVSGPDPEDAVRERTFHFTSDRDPNTRSIHMRHRINGIAFEMDRVDERVPFGETEIWSFVNDNNFAHPVHLHATHFRILARSGGRGRVMPWEGGIKDTVLLYPAETVRVAVRFSAHRGLFLLHCHNLEHEDVGMMLNVMVE